jgi:hypothetical protein
LTCRTAEFCKRLRKTRTQELAAQRATEEAQNLT